MFGFSLLIFLLNRLDIIFLAIYNKAKYNKEFFKDKNFIVMIIEFDTNKIFLKKNS